MSGVELPVRAAVFASGSGSNLQALLDREAEGAAWETVLLVSDRDSAGALARAERGGVATKVIPVQGRDAPVVEHETLEVLAEVGAQVVFLAGYLRLVPTGVIASFRRRVLNIHPALLPSFGGKGMYGHYVHEAVLAAGARFSGPTVHIVDEEYDKGTILAQWPVPVLAGDRPEDLAARVLGVEHLLYPLVAEHLCQALAGGEEVVPLVWHAAAFSLAEDLEASGIARRFRETFNTDQLQETT